MKGGGDIYIGENTSRNTHNVVAGLLFEEAYLKKVLDIPCGEGAFIRRLLEKKLDVCAGDCVDIFKVGGADFKKCDMNRPLPFEEDEFDAIVCVDGIEHIERPFDFIRECRRIIRNKGVLVISTPNISSLRSRWRWTLTDFHNKCKSPLYEAIPSPLHHISMLSFPNLRYMLHTNSFRIHSIRTNRVKTISWVYSTLVPISYLVTWRVFNKEEENPDQRPRNREIRRQMFSTAVLFGETLIIKAVCEK